MLLQQENEELRQRVASLEQQLATRPQEKREERLRSLFEHAPVAYQSLDEQGLITDVNPAFCQLVGYSARELLGTSFGDLWASPTSFAFSEVFDDLKQTNQIQAELQLVGKDGTLIEVVLHGNVQRDAEGKFIRTHCILHDITERKQAEEKLRESEKQNRLLFETMLQGVVYQAADGQIINANPAALEILGLSMDQLTGHTSVDPRWHAIHEDGSDYPSETHPSMMALRTGKPVTHQIMGVYSPRHEGYRWISINSIPLFREGESSAYQVYTTFDDITALKQAEQAIRYSEQRFATIFEHSPVAIGISRLSDGKLIQINSAFSRLYGFTREESLGHTTVELGIWTNMADRQRLVDALQAHQHVNGQEFTTRLKSGAERQVLVWGEYVEINGDPCLMAQIIDIAERKQAEQEVRLKDRLLQMTSAMTNVGGWEFDPLTQEGTWTDEVARIHGLDPTQATNVSLGISFYVGESRTAIEKAVEEAITKGKPYDLTLEMMDATGVKKWVRTMGLPIFEQERVVKVQGIFQDVSERKLAEEKLRASEERYRGLMESLDSVVAAVDYDGTFLYMNDIAARQLGGTPQTLIGKTIQELFPESIAAHQLEGVRQVLREDKGHTSESLSFVQGESRWYHNSLQPIHDEHGQAAYVLLHSTDIHELKSTQQKLAELNRTLEERIQQATAELQDLYDNAPAGYHSLDANGCFVQVNQTELNWLGYSRDEVIGHPFANFVTDQGFARFKQNFQRFKERGWLQDIEIEFLRKDRTTFQALVNATAITDKNGTYLMSRSTVFDITERKQAEQALQTTLKRVNALYTISQGAITASSLPELLEFVGSSLVHALPADKVIVIALDVPSRQVECAIRSSVEFNENWEITFDELWAGLSGWALRERTIAISDYTAPDERESPIIQQRRHNAQAGYVVVIPLIYQDKLLGTLTATNRPDQKQFDPREIELMQVIANQAAIAIERFRTETNLRMANQSLERAMRIKDEFLANMSHELRTPLNGILGMAELLLTGHRGPLNERQQAFVHTIEASGRHLLSLINDILDLSKIEADKLDLHLETVAVMELCQASLAFIKEPAAKKGVKLGLSVDGLLTTLQADTRRVKQILANLLNNAVKFTPAGGQVTLAARLNGDTHCVELSVRDTGIGIAPEDQARLFAPFTQVDNSLTRHYEGTGLGLALVKRLTELHGGRVSLESTPGQGSCFTVILPWQASEPAPPPSPDPEAAQNFAPAPQDQKNKATLLLAEDNPNNVLALADYLDAKGYSLVIAKDGYEVLDKAAASAPDLILMDIQMPNLDGLEATRRLRADPQFATTPILALTAFAMSGDRERCLAAGATAYLSKPVQLKELAAMIETLLAAKAAPPPIAP